MSQILVDENAFLEHILNSLTVEARRISFHMPDDVMCYLGHMLTHYSHADNLLVQETEQKAIPTLAFLYQDARDTKDMFHRLQILRKLGDSALFLGAWLSDMYARKGIGADYFVGMGSAAYEYLGENDTQRPDLYLALAKELPTIMLVTKSVLGSKNTEVNDNAFVDYQFMMAHNTGHEH